MANPIATMVDDPAGAAAELARSPLVPGIAVAGVRDGHVCVGAGGEATTETRFRPGSITKLLTATLVAQCAEEGLLELDDPVDRYVEGFDGITIRHLITHSSGIDAGDLFTDTGDDDGAVARYVELLRDAGRLFVPGQTFSYCNGGFVLAGHVVSLVRGMSWEDVVRRHLFEPLGMTSSGFETVDDEYEVEGVSLGVITVRALGPAGGTLVSTAEDLGRFLADHLARPERAWMRELAAPAPGGVALMKGAGAGWMAWHGSTRIGGANPGMSGYLAVDEGATCGIVALTNGQQGVNAVAAMLDAAAPTPPDQGPPPSDLSALEGRYESHAMQIDVTVVDGALTVATSGASVPLLPLDAHTFQSMLGPIAFFDGLARWRMRVLRRVA